MLDSANANARVSTHLHHLRIHRRPDAENFSRPRLLVLFRRRLLLPSVSLILRRRLISLLPCLGSAAPLPWLLVRVWIRIIPRVLLSLARSLVGSLALLRRCRPFLLHLRRLLRLFLGNRRRKVLPFASGARNKKGENGVYVEGGCDLSRYLAGDACYLWACALDL